MHLDNRSSMVILTIIVVGLATAVGVMIPLASGGSRGSAAPTAWTPPPTATITPAVSATMTRPPITARVLSPTPSATLTATQQLTATPTRSRAATPTRQPLTATTASASPTLKPTEALTPTPTRAATVAAARTATTTGAAPAPTMTAPAGAAPIAQIREGPLNLRTGPGPDQTIVAVGQVGATFTVTARTADNTWLQVCCVGANRAWLFAEYVVITGTIASVPVIP